MWISPVWQNEHISTYPFPFGRPPPSGHHRALRRVPYAVRRFSLVVLYTVLIVYICQSQAPNSSHLPLSPLVSIDLFSDFYWKLSASSRTASCPYCSRASLQDISRQMVAGALGLCSAVVLTRPFPSPHSIQDLFLSPADCPSLDSLLMISGFPM